MSTLKTHNLQSPDAGSINVALTQNAGMVVVGISTFSEGFGGDVIIDDKIVHRGDTNNAIRFPAADTITLETAGSERLRIDSSGRLLIGTTSNRVTRLATISFSPKMQLEDDTEAAFSMSRFINSNGPPRFVLQKARGTGASPVVVQNNDDIGQILFSGWDGDTFTNGAEILAEVDGTPGDDVMPGRLIFKTNAGGTTNTERLRINSAGISTFYNDLTIDTTALATTADLTIRGGEGSQAQIYLIADDGDNGGDNWRISAMAGFSNRLIFYNSASGSYTDVVSFQTDGTIRPGTNNSANLGTSSYRWANVYTNDLHLSNQGSTNSVDNTWGDFTIQEGESDLFLINNRSGKKYKFNLTEVS